MIIAWTEKAWEDYLYWQNINKKTPQRINLLIKDIKRKPFDGLGDPEPLKFNWSGYWFRRLDRERPLIYKHSSDTITIVQARYHY